MDFTNPILYLNKELPHFEKYKKRVKDEDFFIPKINEHYFILQTNYTVSQLKLICKHYKLPRSGSKNHLIKIIYNYLYLSDAALKIQKLARGFLIRKINVMRGPALFKRSLCVNDTDFFTLEPLTKISINQFYSVKDIDGFIYGFDILSLWQLFKKSTTVQNPYNRQTIPSETYLVLRKLIYQSKNINQKINIQLEYPNVNVEKELELRIIELFQFINTLGNYSDHSWFLNLDKIYLIRFCRELYDIWNHRAQLTEEVKRKISPRGNPFRSMLIHSLDSSETLFNIRKTIIAVMENMIYHGLTNDDKSLGAYYILTALTLQSPAAADALPWLYQSVI